MDRFVDELSVPVAVMVADRFVYANAAFMRTCGDVAGKSWMAVFAAEDHQTLASAIDAVQQGHTRRHQVRCQGVAIEVSLSPATHDGEKAIALSVQDISVRLMLADRLMESEARFQRLVSSVADPIVAADARGRIVLWNDAATRAFGYSEIDALGEPFSMLFPRELADDYSPDRFADTDVPGLGRTTVSRARREDGSVFPTQLSFASSDYGGTRWFTAVIHDDSERQQLIESLARSEASFRALVEQSPDPVFVHGPSHEDFDVAYVNAAMVALLGYDSANDLIGRTSLETFVHPDDREHLRDYRRRRHQGDDLPPITLRWVRRDGAVLDIQAVSRPVRFADRSATLVFARDITDRLRQEHERARAVAVLRESEERHRVLFDANPLPAWMIDPSSLRFTAVNDAMVRTYGYTREELLGMTVLDLKVAGDERELRTGVAASKEGDVVHVGVRKHRRKDGKLLDVDITVHQLRVHDQRAVLGIGIDVTHALRLEEQLRQTQKLEAVGQLAGGIAHDFNNIIGVILSNAELAIEALGDRSAAVEELAEIETAAKRAAALTRQLLAFSRKERRALKRLALDSIVTNVEKMLSRIVGEDIAISSLLAPELGTIEADAGQIEQILMNLVVNARDAMPLGGRIVIETANTVLDVAEAAALGLGEGRYVTLSVADTGCGMDEAVRARIFEPFFTTKEVGKGTGLGLATVFGIVQQNGGAIRVTSQIGHGTTFHIYFPRVEAPAETTVRARRYTAPRASGTVLLVEDDPQLRAVLRRYLASWGYQLLEAENGAVALSLAREHAGSIDVLLPDLVMPELDGYRLSKHILAERPQTRVIFMSGHTEHPALHNPVLAETDCFLQKPFTPQALAEMIRSACAPLRARA